MQVSYNSCTITAINNTLQAVHNEYDNVLLIKQIIMIGLCQH